MDIDITWVLLGLPLAFVLGWTASRVDIRQLRVENRRSPKAYFKGLNYLLNEQQDLAIDAFIEAVQNDPDTSELHFALGSLFRRRGEYDRAVRVHEHLLSRGDLKQAERDRAQHALSLDFLKAGLLDRAEDALAKLEGTRFEPQARLARLAVYERTRDWPQATRIAQQLQTANHGDFSVRTAHYLCEQASELSKGATPNAPAMQEAQALLQRAIDSAPDASRARIELAALQSQAGQPLEAYKTLEVIVERAQAATPLVADQLQKLALQCGRATQALGLLQSNYAQSHSIDVLQAIITLQNAQGSDKQVRDHARNLYVQHLEKEPSLAVAARWLEGEKLEHEQFHPQVQRALDKAVQPLLRYRCAACGFEAQRHFWQCPGCQAWDSYPARRIEEL
ncbi:MAG: lipopolysaccharide assembly protein LapB [Burkholderiaceae bacterium]